MRPKQTDAREIQDRAIRKIVYPIQNIENDSGRLPLEAARARSGLKLIVITTNRTGGLRGF